MTKIAQTPDARIIWTPEHAPASALVFAQNVIDIAATSEAVWSQLVHCVAWPRVVQALFGCLHYQWRFADKCQFRRSATIKPFPH
jgi:hypothetical protein